VREELSLIEISLCSVDEDGQTCRDGTLQGFGSRLADRFAPEPTLPDDMERLLSTLDRRDAAEHVSGTGR
jgi:hypothetical protein